MGPSPRLVPSATDRWMVAMSDTLARKSLEAREASASTSNISVQPVRLFRQSCEEVGEVAALHFAGGAQLFLLVLDEAHHAVLHRRVDGHVQHDHLPDGELAAEAAIDLLDQDRAAGGGIRRSAPGH